MTTYSIKSVCVYCASSQRVHAEYFDAAGKLGLELAKNHYSIVYGGGSAGLMGKVANSALDSGGNVIGVIPQFMFDLEWGHSKLTELHIVASLHERKNKMIELADAIIALPGGCGTFEELLEAITWKRLGLFFGPIIIVNTRKFYDPLHELLEKAVDENFMDERHRSMWTFVDSPDDVIHALNNAQPWSKDARSFAAIR